MYGTQNTHPQNPYMVHTLAIGAERVLGRTVHKFLGRQMQYPAYGAGTRLQIHGLWHARARTPPSASYSREALHTREHTHTPTP